MPQRTRCPAVPDGQNGATAPDITPSGTDVTGLLEALRASGCTRWEALWQIAGIYGLDAVRKAWDEEWDTFCKRSRSTDPVIRTLDEIAVFDPQVANAFLQSWLKGLKGLTVYGDLVLTERTWVMELPDGLTVTGNLLLGKCKSLARLPRKLSVGSTLEIEKCPSWDGRIPDDAKISGYGTLRWAIYSDAHPFPIPLEEWRRLHPDGE